MKFRSSRDKTFKFIFGLLSLLFAILIGENLLITEFSETYVFAFVSIVGLVWVFVIWMFLDTNYKITDKKISYKIGPFYGSILQKDIEKVIVDKTSWDGKKIALAKKGLVIIYNKNKEVYLAPKTNDSFVEYLKKVNPSVTIEYNPYHLS